MKIIASDFDGTIHRKGTISERDKNAVLEWQKKGNHFGIVTGRGPDIFETIKKHNITLDYAIAYNGAIVLDGEGNVLYEDWFERGIEKEYMDFAYSFDYEFAHEYNCNVDPSDTGKEHQLAILLKNDNDAKELAELLNKKFEGRLSSYSNGEWINTVKYGTSKATGIQHYAELKNIEMKDIYTVGDFFNDLPMLQAFNGYVVETGHPDLIKLIGNVCTDIAHLTEIADKN